jgi:hypothetical protein
MSGKEIKGTSKIANYRHGGRASFRWGKLVTPENIEEAKKIIEKKSWEEKETGKQLNKKIEKKEAGKIK